MNPSDKLTGRELAGWITAYLATVLIIAVAYWWVWPGGGL